jgi:uncharacterized protein (DUF3820 family)
MNAESLPLVPFGKYKGQPITTLLNDTKYLEWCKQQEWFQKFPIVYNICVNQTITINNQNSKTPEHNKLQNMFLENKNVEKLLKKVFKKSSKNVIIIKGKITFEGMFNWDLVIENYKWYLCECDETKDECDCEMYKKYIERYNIPKHEEDLKFNELYCEIKPCLGDDYPCVLRKMNTQIELTKNYSEKHNEKTKSTYKKEYQNDYTLREYWDKNKGSYNYCLTQECIYPEYALIIKHFSSTTTTKEQLITIFNQSNIKVIFIDDLIDSQEIKITIEKNEIIENEENKTLKDKVLHLEEVNKQLEEKIKELQEEIKLLKCQKKTEPKDIRNFFKNN